MSSSEVQSHPQQQQQQSSGSAGQVQAAPQRLSPALINLEHLSPEEQSIILTVLERDEQLRQHDQARVKMLKNELHDLRKKSAVNAADENGNSRVCIRCREPLGLVFNAGESCPKCQHKVCKNCKVTLPSGTRWLCTICHKNMQIQLETGEWHYSQLQVDQVPLFGSDLVKASLAKAKHSLTDPTTLPVLTASDLRSSLKGKRRGRRQDSRTSSDYGSSSNPRQNSRRSASSGSEQYSVTDSSEVEAVVEPISGFTFQRVSFRRERKGSDKGSDSPRDRDTTDQGESNEDMGCVCSEQDPSCVPAGLAEDDQDYYIKANGTAVVQDQETEEAVTPAPVIAVHIADDRGQGDEEDEDIDRHFMVHGGLTPDTKNKYGIDRDSQLQADADSCQADGKATPRESQSEGGSSGNKESPLETSGNGKAASLRASTVSDASLTAVAASTPITPAQPAAARPPPSFAKSGSFDSRSHTSVSSLQRRLSPGSNLSKGSSQSMTSLYSQAGEENYGKYVITGDMNFGMNYNYKTNVFEVKIKACRDLAPVDAKRIKSDPYVKTYLLPDKTKASKRKTFIRKGTINPQYDVTLRYHISQSELETRTLSLTVWNNDAFGRNDFLGEVLVNMDSVQLDDYKPRWHPLGNKSQPAEGAVAYKGDLTLSLMYSDGPQAEPEEKDPKKKKKKDKSKKPSKRADGKGVLYVKIKQAKNLVGVRMGGTSNPFVKGYLEPDRSKTGKHKTQVLRGTCNPVWDHVMKFENVTLHSLKERCLELTVWDHETLSSNEFLGGARLNLGTGEYQRKQASWNDATGEEMKSWEQMLKNPGKWTDSTIILRPNMVSRLQFT